MPDLVTGNAAIGQSGGPTAVINQSLAGVIEGLRAGLAGSGKVGRIYGMRHGVRGLVKGSEGLLDLTALDKAKLEAIARTPSAALGSTRDKPDEAYCEKILESCRKNDIRYFFYIGGNDFADTCRIVSEKAAAATTSSVASMCRRRSTTTFSRTTTRPASLRPRATWRSL